MRPFHTHKIVFQSNTKKSLGYIATNKWLWLMTILKIYICGAFIEINLVCNAHKQWHFLLLKKNKTRMNTTLKTKTKTLTRWMNVIIYGNMFGAWNSFSECQVYSNGMFSIFHYSVGYFCQRTSKVFWKFEIFDWEIFWLIKTQEFLKSIKWFLLVVAWSDDQIQFFLA